MGKKKRLKLINQSIPQVTTLDHSVLPVLIFIVALLALFSPLLPSSASYFSMTLTQASVFQALVALMLGLWLPLMLTKRQYRPRRDPVTLTVLVFGLMTLVSLPFSLDPDLSFGSQLWRLTGVWNTLHYVAWFLILSSVLRSRKDWHIFLSVSCAIATVVSFYGLKQWLDDPISGLVYSTLGNQSLLTAYLLPHIFIAAFLLVGQRGWIKHYYWLVILVCASTVLVSASRGAVLALIVSLAVAGTGLIINSSWSRKRRLIFVSIILALPILAIGVIFLLRAPAIKEAILTNYRVPRFIERVVYRDIGTDRKRLWSFAWRGFIARPVFGWGNDSFGYLYDYHFDPTKDDRIIFNEHWQDRAHNQYLDTLISYGVIGLVSFLAIWVTVFYSLAQTICRTTSVKDKKRLAMLGTVFVAYLVFILTMFDTPSQLLVLFAGLALVVSRQEQVKVEPSIEFGGQISQRAVLLVVTLSLSTIVIWINLAPVVRAASIQQAIIQLRSNRSELESLLAKAFRPPNMYIHEMRYTMVTEVQKYHEWAQLRSPEMMAGIRYLATQAEMSANERPFSTCHQISAATVNRLLAAYEPEALDRSEKYAQRLIDLTPNRFDGYLEMAEVAILRDNYDRALELLTEADQRVYARRTDFRARILLLMATARAGQREFDLMTELVAEAEELDPNAYFDARPVIVLARTIQAGDQLDDSLVDFIDRVAGKYSLVPDVKNALEIIRQATIVPTHDSGSTQPEIK